MNFKYGIDDKPNTLNLTVAALQWLAVGVPSLIIIAQVMGTIPGQGHPVAYLQKLLAVTAITLLMQVLFGHKMPLILGPSNIILVAILASQYNAPGSTQTAMVVCGLLLGIFSMLGIFNLVQNLFTARVVAVILLLVAFAITPTIRDLIINSNNGTPIMFNLLYALVFVLLMMVANRYLTGIWHSALIFIAMIGGTAIYYVLLPGSAGPLPVDTCWSVFWQEFSFTFSWDTGVVIAFMLAFLALSINDLGSIQSMAEVLKPDSVATRTRNGLAVTGLGNTFSGFLGIVGPVNFSYSTGIIMATRNASRFTLIPAALAMLLLAFLPGLLTYFMVIPQVIIGCVLLYVMTTQVATGLIVAFTTLQDNAFISAQLIALPVLVGVIIAFLPPNTVSSMPSLLRTILGNGFIVGIICSLILEHLIFREQKNNTTH